MLCRSLLLLIGVLIAFFAQPARADEPADIEPWPEVPAAESELPDREMAELAERFEAILDEWRSLEAGAVRYTIRPEGESSGTWGWTTFESADHSLDWDGRRWRLEFPGVIVTSDGESIQSLYGTGDRATGVIHDPSGAGIVPHTVFWSMFPAVPRGLSGSPVGSRLAGEEFHAIPERVRIDGRDCYQFERSNEEAIPTNATFVKEGDAVRIVEAKAVQKNRQFFRVAAETETLRPVAWALGTETRLEADGFPTYTVRQFPTVVATFGDFRPVGEADVPWRIELTEFAPSSDSTDAATKRMSGTTVAVAEWRDEPTADELHAVEFPDGIPVLDQVRGIGYFAGAPQEEIGRLLAAKARADRYYERLRSEPAPELEGEWVSGDPVKLADSKGQPVKFYLWGLGCGPCLEHLPTLELIYGRNGSNAGETFVAVHHHVDEGDIEKVRAFVRKKGLTFPVLIDAAGTFDHSPGRLHEHYRVNGWPTEVELDSEGRYARSDAEARILSLESSLFEKWWSE